MHVSLDGFVTGPHEEMSWIVMDEEIFQDAADFAATADTALFGRVTYQMMESYWPTVLTNPLSTTPELHHAQWIENIEKIVFSTSLEKAQWNNTRMIKKNITGEMTKLKQQAGEKMLIFGSPGLTHSFMRRGLIDEYKVNINPVILGNGIPLFENVLHKTNLRLLSEKKFRSGVIGLHYQTKNN